jgi:hypothetical protein
MPAEGDCASGRTEAFTRVASRPSAQACFPVAAPTPNFFAVALMLAPCSTRLEQPPGQTTITGRLMGVPVVLVVLTLASIRHKGELLTRSTNTPAVRLYRSFGFAEEGHHRDRDRLHAA